MIKHWQKDWSWWRRFRYNWIPSKPDEWGCAGCLLVLVVFALLALTLIFSLLVKGIGWTWGI